MQSNNRIIDFVNFFCNCNFLSIFQQAAAAAAAAAAASKKDDDLPNGSASNGSSNGKITQAYQQPDKAMESSYTTSTTQDNLKNRAFISKEAKDSL